MRCTELATSEFQLQVSTSRRRAQTSLGALRHRQRPNTSEHVAESCFIHNFERARRCDKFENVGVVNKQSYDWIESFSAFIELNMSQKETIEVNYCIITFIIITVDLLRHLSVHCLGVCQIRK